MSVATRTRIAAASFAVLLLASTTATSAPASSSGAQQAVAGFGSTHTAPDSAEHPKRSMRYQVVFDITKGNDDKTKLNRSLDKVARFMNLLAEDGVRPKSGDVVAVIHGDATPIVVSDAAWKARGNTAENPNLELIDKLRKAGVSVRVCSQALASESIAPDAVDKRVQIDVAAITTLANFQLRGHALIPD